MTSQPDASETPSGPPEGYWPHTCDTHGQVPAWAACSRCGRFLCRGCRHEEAASGHSLCRGCAMALSGRAVTLGEADVAAPPSPLEPSGLTHYPATVLRVVLAPTRFFEQVAPARGLFHAFAFGVICSVLGTVAAMAWGLALGEVDANLVQVQGQLDVPPTLFYAAVLMAMPFAAAFEIGLYTLATHLALTLVRAPSQGISVCAKVVSYAMVAKLGLVVPWIGQTIALVGFVALLILGMRLAHRITLEKTIIAVALPVLLLSGLGLFAMA